MNLPKSIEYNIGDTVWFMSNNSLSSALITGLYIGYYKERQYHLGHALAQGDKPVNWTSGYSFFPTRDALIEKLIGKNETSVKDMAKEVFGA